MSMRAPGRQENKVLPRVEGSPCDVCGAPMHGRVLQDARGRVLCGHHDGQVRVCRFCDRAFLATAGSSSRTACPQCERRAVSGETYGRYARLVTAWFARHALELPSSTITEPLDCMPRLPSGLEMLGYTARESGFQKPARIVVRAGLPPEVLYIVLTHEHGHLWLDRYGAHLPEHLTEGVCDWLAHALAVESPAEEMQWQARRIERRDDPVYGRGFKAVSQVANGGSPAALPSILKRL